jgi:hypothetical protein
MVGLRLIDTIHPGEIALAESMGGVTKLKDRALKAIDAWATDQSELGAAVQPLPLVLVDKQDLLKSNSQATVSDDAETSKDAAKRIKLKKKILVQKYRPHCKCIDNLFNDANRNGLADAAWTKNHGFWYEDDFVAWAIKQGHMEPGPKTQGENSPKASSSLFPTAPRRGRG